jgi:sugar-phosphatase
MTSILFGRTFAALLFDMDGTLINSIASAERIWGAWAARHGLDVASFLPTVHGVRSVDTIKRLALPGVDADGEAAELTREELVDVAGIVPVPGAVAFVQSLPPDRWAVVTSAPADLARRRMAAAGIPLPRVLVTAEDVTAGKPNPEGYLLASARLGARATDCVVFEDAPAGIEAGEAAGAEVVVVTATHRHVLATLHVTIATYEDLTARVVQDGTISIART